MADKKYKIIIDINSQDFKKQLSEASTAIDKFTKLAQGETKKAGAAWSSFVGNIAANAVSSALSAATNSVKSFVSESLKLASDAEEISNKFNVVFKDVSKDASQAADDLAKGFGMARSEAEKLLSNTGDLLTGFGFTSKAALDLSVQVNSLAGDLASFNNLPTAQASDAITKALLGEREAVKALGISILEEDVKKQVAIDRANGLVFATEREAKAQATLTLAFKQSGNAIGDMARSKNSDANVTKTLNARIHTLKEIVGKQLLPAFTNAKLAVLDFLNSLDENKVKSFADKIGVLFDPKTYKIIGANNKIKDIRAEIGMLETDIELAKGGVLGSGLGIDEKEIEQKTKRIEKLRIQLEKFEQKLVRAATPKTIAAPKFQKEGEISNLEQSDSGTANNDIFLKEKEMNAELDAYRAERKALLKENDIEEKEITLEEMEGFEFEKIRIQQDAEEKLIELKLQGKEKEKALAISREKEQLALTQEFIKKKQAAEIAKQKFDKQLSNERLSLVTNTGNLINAIAGKQTKAGFAITQAATLANVYIKGTEAAVLATTAPPFGLGPVAGAPLAAAIKANTAIQMATIAAQTIQGFETGGVIADGSMSGDRTLIRANRKERVLTPEQNATYEKGLEMMSQFNGSGIIAENIIGLRNDLKDVGRVFIDGEEITDNINRRNNRSLK